MKDGSYFFLTRLLNLFLWRGKLIGRENIPANGPAVIIANHLDAFGPIGTMASLPIRVHPWSVANMMDKDLAPAWLQWDFVERQLHLKPPFSAWFSKTLCRITVPLFYSLGCIPVYRNDYRKMQQTLQMSVQVLGMDKYLLIFPEDPNLGTDPSTNMAPYQHTFTRLGELLFAESGKQLAFYPLTVHKSKMIVLGRPVVFDPMNPVAMERHRLRELLENEITSTYLQLEQGHTAGLHSISDSRLG